MQYSLCVPNTNPKSFLNNLFRSAEELRACRKSKDAALECPGTVGTLDDRPRKSWELLEQLPDNPTLNSSEEFLEWPKMEFKIIYIN